MLDSYIHYIDLMKRNISFDANIAIVKVNLRVYFFSLKLLTIRGKCHTNLTMDSFVKEPTSHSHVPNPSDFHVIRIKMKVKNVVYHLQKPQALSYTMPCVQHL